MLGGDTELIAAMQAAEQEAKRKGREEAWEAARQQAGTSAGPLSIPSSAPEKDQFIRLSTPCFHLNTFIRSKSVPRENRAFGVSLRARHRHRVGISADCQYFLDLGLFLKLGIATPGFGPLKGNTLERVQQQWPLSADFQEPLRQSIAEDLKVGPRINEDDNPASEAAQVALWNTHCEPGAFILCRHAYHENPFMPAALKHGGKYQGDVYVLGRVEEMPPPQSDADRALVSEDRVTDERLAALNMLRCYLHNCAKVNYFALGYIDDLAPATRGYIKQVLQPTLQQILKGSKGKEAEHARIRENLWECATHQIGNQFSAEW